MSTFTDRAAGFNSALSQKAPCRAATTTNITLAGYQTIDGVAFAAADVALGYNMRVLVKNQTTQTENGIYIVDSGNWERAKDFDGNSDFVRGTRVYVWSGTAGVAEYRVTTADPIVIGTSNITFDTTDAPVVAQFVIDGGGGVIDAGEKGYLRLPFNGTITGWSLVGNTSGSMVVDVWKDTYANFPPVVGDTITGSDKPTLSAAQKNTSTALTGWTTTFNEGDWLAFNVDSASGISRATVALHGTRN